MTPGQVGEVPLSRLGEFVTERTGLHFPRDRWDDLQRGLAGAARDYGFADASACADWLLSAPLTDSQLQVLVSHLTIGETYFFRDPQIFEALAGRVLPELIRGRRGGERRLRIWSAACCTGEEPYSLAILLHQVLPELPDWQVTITATDINARFLRKAATGTYGEWSFRGVPIGLKERYFHRTADNRFAVIPEIKKMVTFAPLNLVEDVYPSLATGTNAVDLIFCRNVLMYFTPAQTGKVIGNLRHALVQGGWLVVSPSEASPALFRGFRVVNVPGAILFRKSETPHATGLGEKATAPAQAPEVAAPAMDDARRWTPPDLPESPAGRREPEALPVSESPRSPLLSADSLYQDGLYAEAADALASAIERGPPDPAAFSLLVRALANQGKLAEALAWCQRWLAADKMNPVGHYLCAAVLLEQGDPEQARRALQRAVYLAPDFVLAHFVLGNVARTRGKIGEANRHFENARALLGRLQPDDLLAESDGLTAGRLAEAIAALITAEVVP